MLYDIDKGLLDCITEATEATEVAETPVSEDVGAMAGAATTLLAGGAAAGLAVHAAQGFLNKFNTPKEGDTVKHTETGEEGTVKFQHHNGKLNVDWQSGSNSSHEKHEVVAA